MLGHCSMVSRAAQRGDMTTGYCDRFGCLPRRSTVAQAKFLSAVKSSQRLGRCSMRRVTSWHVARHVVVILSPTLLAQVFESGLVAAVGYVCRPQSRAGTNQRPTPVRLAI